MRTCAPGWSWTKWLGLLLMIVFVSRPWDAAATVRTSTNYYRVTGTSLREVRQSISAQRPWRDAFAQDAQTRWEIRWSYSLRSSPQGCYVHSLQADAVITITLPHWTAGPEATASLRERWTQYLLALSAHEDAHKRIALAAHEEITRRLSGLKAANCEQLRRKLDEAGKAVVAENRRKDAEYDRRTKHGATEGARFP